MGKSVVSSVEVYHGVDPTPNRRQAVFLMTVSSAAVHPTNQQKGDWLDGQVRSCLWKRCQSCLF